MTIDNLSRRGLLLGGAGVFATGLAACGGEAATSGSAKGAIRIGVLAEMSGPLAPYGQSIDRSARLAVDQINAAGGVLGRKLSVSTLDTATSAAKASDLAKQLTLRDKVDLVIGPAGSDENNAAARIVAEQNGRLYFFTEGSEGDKCAPTYFAFSNVPQQQKPFVEFLQQTAGPKAFLFGADYIWPESVFTALKEQIADQSGQVVGELLLPTVADDFTPLVKQLRETRPDYVYCLYPAVFGAALAAMSDAGLVGKFALGTSFVGDSLLTSLGPAAEGMYGFLGYSSAIPDKPAQRFLADYQAAYGANELPGANESVSTFNAVQLFAQAVTAAESTQADKVAEKLVGQTYQGPTGAVTMTSSHACTQSASVVRAVSGRYEFVKTFADLEPGPQGSCG